MMSANECLQNVIELSSMTRIDWLRQAATELKQYRNGDGLGSGVLSFFRNQLRHEGYDDYIATGLAVDTVKNACADFVADYEECDSWGCHRPSTHINPQPSSLYLTGIKDGYRIAVVKIIRTWAGLPLPICADLTRGVYPVKVLGNLSQRDAQDLAAAITNVGGQVSVRPA